MILVRLCFLIIAEPFWKDIKMTKHYEALIDKSLELGAIEARPVLTDEIVFDDRSFLKC